MKKQIFFPKDPLKATNIDLEINYQRKKGQENKTGIINGFLKKKMVYSPPKLKYIAEYTISSWSSYTSDEDCSCTTSFSNDSEEQSLLDSDTRRRDDAKTYVATFLRWQEPIKEWLEPLSEWQKPIRHWQQPLM